MLESSCTQSERDKFEIMMTAFELKEDKNTQRVGVEEKKKKPADFALDYTKQCNKLRYSANTVFLLLQLTNKQMVHTHTHTHTKTQIITKHKIH